MSTTIDIKSPSGQTLLPTPINRGAKGYYSLMQHDYITLPFSLHTPIDFGLGSYVDLRGVFDEALGGKLAKIYYVKSLPTPAYNDATGGYDYTLRLDAYYWLWANFIFKYTPENAGQEAAWSLTAPLSVHMGVYLRNLSALGFTYGDSNAAFTYSIDTTVSTEAIALTYSNTNLIDALNMMAEALDCEWWVRENVIFFGKCEQGDAVELEIGVSAETMTRNESKGTYATRIYAFGSTRNIPTNYRPVTEQTVVNGVVQKRLMLPEGTPYIDAYPNMTRDQVVESVVVFENVYPRRIGTLSDVQTVDRAIEGEDGEQTGTFKAYQYKDTGITFDKSYILPDQELRIVFQSGKLNGLDFAVTFNPNNADPAEQLWEIVANEDYGRLLPDETLKPENGDTYILYNFDIELVSDQYIPAAEEELKEEAEKYVAKTKVDDGTYTVPLYADWVKEDEINRTFDFGQKISLKNPALFGTENRLSRVIGWEMNLDKPHDRPVYTIGESAQYSRIGELEDKVEAITYGGQTYMGGGGSGVYLIKTNDSTPASNYNVFSALRSLAMFLRKDQPDQTNYLIKFLGGLISDRVESTQFATGFLGSGFTLKMDENGDSYLEVDRMLVRKVATFVELLIQELRHVGGQILLTPASMKCSQVEEHDTFYRCYFETTDGKREIFNEFAVGDQARCQTFNVKDEANETLTDSGLEIEDGSGLLLMEDGSLIQQEEAETERSGSVYYWRLVVGVGDNYIDLSKTDCDSGSMAPEAGDDIVQLGNRNDVTRQTAIVLSAYGNDAPYIKMYRGIDSYNLTGKEFFSMSHSAIDIVADSFRFRTGENVKDLLEAYGDELEAQTDELEKMASDNYISPVEKTSLKQQMADIESEYLQITGDAELYDVSTTSYAAAYEKAIASLGKYTADTPEYIPVENDFQDIADYYEARQVILMLLDSAKNDYVLEVSNSVKAELKVTTDAITAEVNSVKTVVEGMNEDVSNALLDAQDAKEAAESAKSEAIAAQDRLDDWSADGVISPTEKQSLRDEISRIDADHEQIADGYSTYVLGTPSTYNTAYTNYRSVLVTLTASTPETITIPSYFETRQETYYQRRAEALSAIAAAAKSYADDAIAEAEGSMTTTITNSVLNVVEGQITAEVNEATYELDQKIEENSSEITLLSNQISSKVSQSQFNSLTNRVSNCESEIEQTATNISITVKQEVADQIANMQTGRNICPSTEGGWEQGSFRETLIGNTYEESKMDTNLRIRVKNLIYIGDDTSSLAIRCNNSAYRFAVLLFDEDQLNMGESYFYTWTTERVVSVPSRCKYISVLLKTPSDGYITPSAVESAKLKVEVGDTYTDWDASTDEIKSLLLPTGIDIDARTVTVTASRFYVQTNSGTPIAVFKSVGNKPVLQAQYIDVDGLFADDLVVRGSMRSPFTYAPSSSEFDYSDNVAMISSTNGFIEPFNLPWTSDQSGRKICVANYRWGSSYSQGYGSVTAPSGKYFFEDGVQKSTLYFSRELVELLGYGDNNTFYGWIVLQRTNLMTVYKYGHPLNCLAMAKVVVNSNGSINTSSSIAAPFDGGDITVARRGTGLYRITYPSGWIKEASDLLVMATGLGQAAGITNTDGRSAIKATVNNITTSYFDIYTSDDDTCNDGSFMFFMYNMDDWISRMRE